ncbi:MAG: PorP/SprF family type IX secretion system membrane protein [Saprospiraceae bacterium]|nr:PorP/SprF family type IX secretion system membrane protein [Saprospiraceae bacterium]MDW8484231.1 PorP/SprF family type IX secretion system membrane protein [Saprospiraceae bacterium]
MKKITYALMFGLWVTHGFTQEQAIYSQYQVFQNLINPAVAGFGNEFLFLANARHSWAGFPGAPQSYTFLYTGPVGDKLGLGGSLFTEHVGDQVVSRLQGIYSFRFKIDRAEVGLGLTTEFLRRRLNNNILTNPLVDARDDVLEAGVVGQQIFTSSFGAHLLYDEAMFISIVLPTAIRARLDEIPTEEPRDETGAGLRHFILQLGGILNFYQHNFKLLPSIAVRSIRDVPFQVDLNLQSHFMEGKLIAGITYRPNTRGSMAFLIGTRFNRFNLFYSYDLSFGPFQQYNFGSHELSLAYTFKRKKPPIPIQNTNIYQQAQ